MKKYGTDMNKIVYKKGCIINALQNNEIDYLIHQCNSKGVMGAGLAKQVKERIPEAYTAYMDDYKFFREKHGKDLPLGLYSSANGVINLVAQEGYGKGKRFTNYGALASAFCSLFNGVQDFDSRHPTDLTIGIPKYLGCGLGGGDWEIVLELIEHCLDWCNQVVIYEL